jgi:CHAD domain-containing protein
MSDDESTSTQPEIDVEMAPIEEVSDLSLAEAVRARALEVNSATRDLVNSPEAFSPEGIHDIRVATKRLRALWQLFRPVIEPQVARTADQRLREIAYSVAGARDSDVSRGLLSELRDAEEPLYHGAFNRAAALFPEEFDFDEIAKELRAMMLGILDEDRGDWQSLVLPDNNSLIEHGLGRAYRKAARRAATAERTDDHGDNHRWRRWVKYLRYQLEALSETPSEKLATRIEALASLGSLLGQRNDLAVLREQVEARGGGDTFGAVFRAIQLRDSALRRRLGEDRLFDLSPEAFAEIADGEIFDDA